MSTRRGVYEADLAGRKLTIDYTVPEGSAGRLKWIEVPVKVRWLRERPLAVELDIKIPKQPLLQWTLSLAFLRSVFENPVGTEIGFGVVRVKREGFDLVLSWYGRDRKTGEAMLLSSLILQAGAVEYVLKQMGIPEADEVNAVSTAVDILLASFPGIAITAPEEP